VASLKDILLDGPKKPTIKTCQIIGFLVQFRIWHLPNTVEIPLQPACDITSYIPLRSVSFIWNKVRCGVHLMV